MNNIVERLNDLADAPSGFGSLCMEAVAEITSLRAKLATANERLAEVFKSWESEKQYADRWRQLRERFYYEQKLENQRAINAAKEKP